MPDAEVDPVVAALRDERRRQGMTQTDVARAIGRKTYQTVHQWEKGTNPPSIVNARAWANALGLDLTLTRISPPGAGDA